MNKASLWKYAPVSVIMPCYNSEKTIERAVTSIYSQTIKPNEILIIDDGSTDNSVEIIYKLSNRLPKGWIKLITLGKNYGPSKARNIGIDIATQEYIAFLDSDDIWHPQKIEIQLNFMTKYSDIKISAHRRGGPAKDYFCSYNRRDINIYFLQKEDILYSNIISTPSVMFKKPLNIRFDEKRKYSEDFFLWLSILCKGIKIAYLGVPLAFSIKRNYYRLGLSSNFWNMEKGELQNYKDIYKSKCITKITYIKCVIYSLLKFIRRLLIYKFIEKIIKDRR